MMAKVLATMWKVAVKDKPIQMISVSDIGYYAAQAFINPSSFNARGISLAGDFLTLEEVSKVFKEKTGQELQTTYGFVAKSMLWMLADFGTMFNWFYTDGFGADIQTLRRENPKLLSFSDWLVNKSAFKTVG